MVSGERVQRERQAGPSSRSTTQRSDTSVAIAPPVCDVDGRVDPRPEAAAQRDLQGLADGSARVLATNAWQRRISARPPVQAWLTVRGADDRYEAQAHQVADAVRAGQPARPSSWLHTPPTGGGLQIDAGLERSIDAARGGGTRLPAGLRAQMEGQLGADFGGVRLHTDARADHLNREIDARAFTTGPDIFLRRGEGSRDVLAHELSHVVQQGAAGSGSRVIQRMVVEKSAANKLPANLDTKDFAATEQQLTALAAAGESEALRALAGQLSVGKDKQGGYWARAIDDVYSPMSDRGNLTEFADKVASTAMTALFRQILVLDVKNKRLSPHEETRQLAERQQLTDEQVLAAVSTTCDVNAYAMMVGAAGIEDTEKLKAAYMKLYQKRMADPKAAWNPATTDAGGAAFLFLRGEGDRLMDLWMGWARRPGASVMKVKFDHLDAGPHTFVVERKNGRVALYQAYEKKYSLKDYMDSTGGQLMPCAAVGDNQIGLLCGGLGSPQDAARCETNEQDKRITSEMYNRAFGASLNKSWKHDRFGEAIPSVAILISDKITGMEAQPDLSKVGYYEEIQPAAEYDKLVHPPNPHTKVDAAETAKLAELIDPKVKSSMKGLMGGLRLGAANLKKPPPPPAAKK